MHGLNLIMLVPCSVDTEASRKGCDLVATTGRGPFSADGLSVIVLGSVLNFTSRRPTDESNTKKIAPDHQPIY
jgi:hypothetical protein